MKRVGHGRVVAAALIVGACVVPMLSMPPASAAHKTDALYEYTSTPFDGQCSDGGSGTASRSIVQVSRRGSTISVTVRLVGAANATYEVALLQAGACFTQSTAHAVTTDGDGNGTVQFSEQAVVAPGQNALIVDVVVPAVCPTPCTIEPEPNPAYRSAVLRV